MKRFFLTFAAVAVLGLLAVAPPSLAQTVIGTGVIAQTTSDTPLATTGSESTLASYTLPANAFTATGKRLQVVAEFSTANNGDLKNMNLYFGSQKIQVANVTAAGNFVITFNVIRSGSAQQTIWQQLVSGTTASAASVSGTESDAAAIIIKATATGAALGDVTLNDFYINALN